MNMRIRKNSITHRFLLAAGLFTVILFLAGEVHAAGALWVVIVCLLPPLMLALRTSYLSVKFFCATVFVTQIITVPVFYLQRDRYAFSDHRPFGFTALEAMYVFLILGLFLLLLVYLTKLAEKAFGAPVKFLVSGVDRSVAKPLSQNIDLIAGAAKRGASKSNMAYTISIVLLVSALIPFNFWMFDMGIGITGAPPPLLPYRLSGILTYLQNYILPVLIGYLYFKTKRNSFLLVVILSVYALLLGISTASKGAVLMVTAPLIAFAWLDKRWGILAFSAMFAGVGVTMASTSREIVHVADGVGGIGSFTELGTLETLAETFSRLEYSQILLVFAAIAGRIEGFQGLFLASQFNPVAVGGSWKLLMNAILNGWGNLDHVAIHLEYLGYSIPAGFYGVVASVPGYMMLAANNNILMVLPFAAFATTTLVVLEKTLLRTAYKYRFPLPLAQVALFYVTLVFYTSPGSEVFKTLFLVSIALRFIPALRLRKTNQGLRCGRASAFK